MGDFLFLALFVVFVIQWVRYQELKDIANSLARENTFLLDENDQLRDLLEKETEDLL